MKKKSYIKMLVIGCILILLGTCTIPIATSNVQKQNTVKINIYDSTNSKITKTERYLSADQAQQIITAFLNTEMTQDLFYTQIQEKLKILQDNQLISETKATTLTKIFTTHQNLLQRRTIPSNPAAYFDVANLINLVIFGLRGEKDRGIVDINLVQFPFFNGTIAAQFSLASKFTGNGTVFSLGLLGFKYSYGQNQTQYPTFPHFPSISGGVIGFTGILIDVESAQPGTPGHYVVGVGLSFVTAWDRV